MLSVLSAHGGDANQAGVAYLGHREVPTNLDRLPRFIDALIEFFQHAVSHSLRA